MNSMFGEWYRQATIEPKSGELESRWQGIADLTSRTDPSFAADVVRLHFGLPVSEAFTTEFRQVFFTKDSTFRMTGNEVELRVLAGALLMELIGRKDVFSDGVALTVIAVAFPEARKKLLLADLLTAANSHIFDRGLAVRSVVVNEKAKLTAVDATLEKIKQALAAGTAPWADVQAALATLGNNVTKLSQNTEARVLSLQRQQDTVLEESNIVWWVFGGAVRETARQFSELPAPEAAITAAADLAFLTKLVPPPIAFPAYLERALGTLGAAEISIQQVASLQLPWVKDFQTSHFPLLTCIASAANGKLPKDASADSAKQFQLRPGNLKASVISVQFYRELLAGRFLQKKG